MDYIYILLFVNISFLVIAIVKEKYLFSLNTIFNAYALLYFFYGLFVFNFRPSEMNIKTELITLAIIAVISFNLTYYIFKKKIIKPLFKFEETTLSNSVGIILMVIGLSAELILILKVGPINFLTMDRYERFPILKQNDYLVYLINLINISLAIFLNNYLKYKDDFSKKLLYFCTLHNILYFILMISRSHLLLNFIIFGYLLERYNKLKKKSIIIYGSVLVFVMFFYKSFLYSVLLGKSEIYFNYGEVVNWIRNSILLFNLGIDSNDLPNNSYLLALKSLFVLSPKEDALSEWFVYTFFPSQATEGFTMGFSGLIEGYLYMNTLGVVLHFALIGFICAMFEKRETDLFTIIKIFLLYTLYKVFRSEIYNFVKSSYWYYIVPILGVYFFDYLAKSVIRRKK
ncbi:O-antigen polymerase [Guptibacillus spartinae]|uniref:O-antigen polymerase n=1 Tax=Guptibacillus spartinae TaxID=3025679 RepID=UPI002361DFF4|nr:O-antigen polymerase [Pseudalkalibacillus spartinae]